MRFFDQRKFADMKRLWCWVFMALSLTLPDVVLAGPFEDAGAAYQHKDYAAALALYRSLAEQSDIRAQGNLAVMYSHREGVPQDYTEALKWYRRADDKVDPHAQYNLGVQYEHGRGVTENYAEALKWYRLAAD